MKLSNLITQARRIRLVLTDCDGVLTDGGVYYSERGEEMKRPENGSAPLPYRGWP